MTEVYYNSHDTGSKHPFGAVRKGEEVTFTVKTETYDPVTVYLNYYHEDPLNYGFEKRQNIKTEVLRNSEGIHTAALKLEETGLWFYWFSVSVKGVSRFYGNCREALGGPAYLYENEDELVPYQITVHENTEESPEWYRKGIFYQIFPDRFCNGDESIMLNVRREGTYYWGSWYDLPMYVKAENGDIAKWDFAGGNLRGIIKNLDYIKSLGATALYLNPIFKARSNHRYDTGDYHKIDELLGTEKDFQELIDKSAKKNISIMLDGVFNHTGADSKYFNISGKYESTGAYNSKESPYYEWYTFRTYPTDYEAWWDITDLPNVNENNESYRNFMLNQKDGVVPYWLKKGVKGWRLDVADELPDEFIKGIRSAMRDSEESDTMLIGEVWEDASNKISYDKRREYLLGEELMGVMNYPFTKTVTGYLNGTLSANDAYMRFMSLKENYPKNAYYSSFNSLSTHDTARILTVLKDERLLESAVGMLMTYPGVPSIYYGDEVGLRGDKDPDNRRTYPWGREDRKILELYRKMAELRNSSEAFTLGDFLPAESENVLSYRRKHYNQDYIVIINANDSEKNCVFRFSDSKEVTVKNLKPYSFTVKKLQ